MQVLLLLVAMYSTRAPAVQIHRATELTQRRAAPPYDTSTGYGRLRTESGTQHCTALHCTQPRDVEHNHNHHDDHGGRRHDHDHDHCHHNYRRVCW